MFDRGTRAALPRLHSFAGRQPRCAGRLRRVPGPQTGRRAACCASTGLQPERSFDIWQNYANCAQRRWSPTATMPRLQHSSTGGPWAKSRLNDFDVTGTVQVSSTAAVREAVEDLCQSTWEEFPFEPLKLAFNQFERMFAGEVPRLLRVDTVYHDRQHTLDVTLALARLMAGHDRAAVPADRLGANGPQPGSSSACSMTWATCVARMMATAVMAPN